VTTVAWDRRAHWRARRRAPGSVGLVGGVLTVIPTLGLHVNLSVSAPAAGPDRRGSSRSRGVGGGLRERRRGRSRACPGLPLAGPPYPGGVEPVLKPVVAGAGDIVDLGPDAVIVTPSASRASRSAIVDGLGDPLPHAAWGRHAVAADEVWVVSTRVPNSWDSRYLGPVPVCPSGRTPGVVTVD
jgi:hypothetical protein